MREPLTVAVTQPPCVSYDVAANALTAAATVRSAGARVVVFPELFLTGYELDAPALDVDDPRLAPIVEACAEAGSLALVGAPVHGNAGGSHIAMLAIDDTRAAVAYHKMWLGAAESNRFTPGRHAGPTRGRRLAARSGHMQGHRHFTARPRHRRLGYRRLPRRNSGIR
jgi:predicted amidohydrolase